MPHLVVRSTQIYKVAYLVEEKGASLNERDAFGNTPLEDFLISGSYTDEVYDKYFMSLLKYFSEQETDQYEKTLLYFAINNDVSLKRIIAILETVKATPQDLKDKRYEITIYSEQHEEVGFLGMLDKLKKLRDYCTEEGLDLARKGHNIYYLYLHAQSLMDLNHGITNSRAFARLGVIVFNRFDVSDIYNLLCKIESRNDSLLSSGRNPPYSAAFEAELMLFFGHRELLEHYKGNETDNSYIFSQLVQTLTSVYSVLLQ